MMKMLNRSLYSFIKITCRLLAWAFFRLKVEGRENLPKEGSFIVASNHTSFLDPGIIQVSLPVKVSWIAKKGVFAVGFLRPLHHIFDSIPINGSVKKALTALEEGRVLGIFPEGTRSPNGKLKEADTGVAILALKSGRPVIPVGIKGAFNAYPPGKRFFRPRPITVKIGKPLYFKKIDEEDIEKSLLVDTKNRIMDEIRTLL